MCLYLNSFVDSREVIVITLLGDKDDALISYFVIEGSHLYGRTGKQTTTKIYN